MSTRSAPKEIALLNKLEHMPVMPRRQIHLRRFDLSRYPVLCWYHGVIRRGRRYSLQCDVQADGSLAVLVSSSRGNRSARREPKAKHFRGLLWR
jgi:hypothetical protein